MTSPDIVKILKTNFVTHNVKSFLLERPQGFEFKEGQHTEVAINTPDMNTLVRPFTLTSINEDLILEFTIKSYPEHNGVTKKIHELKPGDEIILSKPSGTIQYKGPGTFIAGGTGITPFMSIFRKLKKENKIEDNKLIFANKKHEDIIYEKELINTFGENATFILSEESYYDYEKMLVDKEYLERQNLNKEGYFYVCGPEGFTNAVIGILVGMGIEGNKIVREA